MNNNKFKILFPIFLLVLFVLFSCSDANNEDEIKEKVLSEKEKREILENDAIATYVSTLSLEQKIGQLFVVSVDGTSANLSATTHPIPPGGYLLFSRNTKDGAKKIISLTGDTQTYYSELKQVPPYFSIDHEGGLVHRLRDVASPLPSAKTIKNTLPPKLAEEIYYHSAKQLKALGIQVNLGPVAEVLFEYNKDFLDYRSFGDFNDVEKYGRAFIDGFTRGGVYCVLKHFPGNSNDDPHYRLPVLNQDKDTILSSYVKPFQNLVQGNGLLMSHIVVTSYDDETPACLSPIIINELVYGELDYEGLIFTDDILMNALSQNGYPPDVAIEMALLAGVNVLMSSHPAYWNLIDVVIEVANKNPAVLPKIEESVSKIIKQKVSFGLMQFVDVEGTLLLESVSVNNIYKPEQQYDDFISARNDGLSLYYQYWAE